MNEPVPPGNLIIPGHSSQTASLDTYLLGPSGKGRRKKSFHSTPFRFIIYPFPSFFHSKAGMQSEKWEKRVPVNMQKQELPEIQCGCDKTEVVPNILTQPFIFAASVPRPQKKKVWVASMTHGVILGNDGNKFNSHILSCTKKGNLR